MEKKTIIPSAIGIGISVLLLVMYYTGYPAGWFIHIVYSDASVPKLVNYCIISCISILCFVLMEKKDKFSMDVFFKYILLFLVVSSVTLFAHYVGYKMDKDKYFVPSDIIFFDGVLLSFFRNFSAGVLFSCCLAPAIYKLPLGKYKELILSCSVSLAYILFSLLFNIKAGTFLHLYYLSIAFGIGMLLSYLFCYEKSSFVGPIYYGFIAISELPLLFISSVHMLTACIIGCMYLIIGAVSLGHICILINKNDSDEK